MKSYPYKPILVAATALFLHIGGALAQNITEIAKSDPLIITGAVGTQNTYFHSSAGNAYASPLSNTLFLNLNISLYGFSMPFSLYYSNNNLDFNYPHLSFNLSPSYKHWHGHLGRSSTGFSPYVMNMSYNGVGLDYVTDRFRVGAFYGTLRSAVNDDPSSPSPRAPQYRRLGWGFTVGYGSTRNHLDLYLLRAYDRAGSVDAYWQERLSPQENLVVGLRGGLSLRRWLSLSANVATSLFSTDTRAPRVTSGQATRFDKVFDARYSSLARFAGDANIALTLPNFNTSVFYRIIQPDYTSLGTYYMANNYHSLGLNMGTTLFRRVSLSATFSGQEDNLSGKQLYTTRGFVYSAFAATRLGSHLSLALGYNGYLQTQADGTAHVNDTTRVHRAMHTLTLTPSYSIETDQLSHAVSLSASYVANRDLNRLSSGMSDVTSLAAGLSYSLGVNAWDTQFTAALNHQSSRGYNTRYTSDIASLTTSRSFLKDGNLNLSATLSMCYNEIEHQSKSLSVGCDVAASYSIKQQHLFSLAAGFNKYGDVNISKTRSSLDATDINLSLNYTYTFTLLEIKRKAERQAQRPSL